MAKSKRIDKSEFAMMGDEPIYNREISRMEFARALNWYNHFYSTISHPKIIDWLVEYMQKNKYTKQQIKHLQQIAPKYIPTTLCSTARIINNGADFEECNLNLRIYELLKQHPIEAAVRETISAKPVVINMIRATLDDLLDEFYKSDYRKVPDLTNITLAGSKEYQKIALQYYTELLNEIEDPELRDNRMTALQTKRYKGLVKQFIELLSVKKIRKITKTRKVRVKKMKSADQLTALLQYKAAEKIGKDTVESIKPTKILESTELWVYNSAKRLLTHFVSSNGPIIIHRTTLKNFDKKQSQTKKIRKPELIIQFANEGKATIKKLFNNIKAKPKTPNGRMNSDTLIIRAFR